MPDEAYERRQIALNKEYKDGWKNAPKSFLNQAEAIGIEAAPLTTSGCACEVHESNEQAHYSEDMASLIDTQADELIEKYGAGNRVLIEAIVEELRIPMRKEIERNRSLALGRVILFMVNTDRKNMLASIHQLMHAIPRLAVANGFASMGDSARACGVSREWIRKGRDRWCEILGLDPPADTCKSEGAKLKYREIAINNHHTRQKFVFQPQQTTSS